MFENEFKGSLGTMIKFPKLRLKEVHIPSNKETRIEHVSVLEAVGTALASPPHVIGPHTATHGLFAGV